MASTTSNGTGDLGIEADLFKAADKLRAAPELSAHGSVTDTITTATSKRAMVSAPTGELISEYEGICRPLQSLILERQQESRTFTATRDLLLPKLMSGDIRLKDAEAMV